MLVPLPVARGCRRGQWEHLERALPPPKGRCFSLPIVIVAALASEREHQVVQDAISQDHELFLAAVVHRPEQIEPARLEHNPDLIIVSSQFAIDQTEGLVERLSARWPLQVIVIVPSEDPQLIRTFVKAGAADVIPLSAVVSELPTSVRVALKRVERHLGTPIFRRGQEPGQIITFYGPKGGVGTSLIAVNTAVAMASRLPNPVALVDLSLQFGTAGMLLNLSVDTTIASLAQRFQGELDWDGLQPFLLTHPESGLQVLAAPSRPELADIVSTLLTEKALQVLKEQFRYVIVDTPSTVQDTTLTALDAADVIVIVSALDVLAIRNTQLVLEMFRKLYPSERLRVILNRANANFGGLTASQVENILGVSLTAQIPSDGQLAVTSLNEGVPFVLRSPQAPLSQAVFQLAATLAQQPIGPITPTRAASNASVLRRLVRFFIGEE
ncbi:MAG: AAA family ATPase [Armatimonadetes bacterium]|nr:AAA family ATPase [Armatimonadota bacterium]MDW8121662.1 AAA family ATPase [Armatimonadota bacterium]